ncbi:unnamed protein product [Hymenolepis diminuta]|uniref:Uncharacterized protein n=1 Tax=Hymenolepis diminuta TaxID=6216 RepID=A0A564YLU1_HYMDI|nr:unnamed protein product [Hymenolepis diminuta]
MIQERNDLIIVDFANEYRKVDIKCDIDMNLQKSGEQNCVNRISCEEYLRETGSQNVTFLH